MFGNDDKFDFTNKSFFMDGCMRVGYYIDERPMKNIPNKIVIRYRTLKGEVKEIANIDEGMCIQLNRDQLGGVSSFPVNYFLLRSHKDSISPFEVALKERVEERLMQGQQAMAYLKTKVSVERLVTAKESQTDMSQLKKSVEALRGLQISRPKEEGR